MSTETLGVSLQELYDKDFVLWAEETARLLRAGAIDDLDIENLAEEIESIGRKDRRELRRRLKVLLSHLLKWQFQAAKRSISWESTIFEQREEIAEVLDESPSLRRTMPAGLSKAYPSARKAAAIETGMLIKNLPPTCPYSLEQVLDESFLPK